METNESRSFYSSMHKRAEKNREREELRVMLLGTDSTCEQLLASRQKILELCKEEAKKLATMPFGEMKPKDLRSLDSNLSFSSEPKILVRTLCALIALDPVYAFVMPKQVLLIIPAGADGILQSINNHLQAVLQTDADRATTVTPPSTTNMLLQPTLPPQHVRRESSDADMGYEPPILPSYAQIKEDRLAAAALESPMKMVSSTISPTSVSSAKTSVQSPEMELIVAPQSTTVALTYDEIEADATSTNLPPSNLNTVPTPDALIRTRSYSSSTGTPFQFVALEILFDTAAIQVTKDLEMLKLEGGSIKDIVAGNRISAQINAFRAKVVAMRDVIEDFISSDKDVGLFSFNSIINYYSVNDPYPKSDVWMPYEIDINKIQDLSEDIVSRLYAAIYEIDLMKYGIEELLSNLTKRRNSLLLLNVRVQLVTAVLTVAAMIAGIFGISLTSGLGQDPYTVWIVFGILTGGVLALLIILFIVRKNVAAIAGDKD